MDYGVMRLSSVTYAIRAQKLLEQRGIRSFVKRISKDMQTSGCGYGLEIKGDVEQARQIISSAGIRILDVSDSL